MKKSTMKKSVRIALAVVALAGALLFGFSTVKADDSHQPGWYWDGSYWYYYKTDGQMATGWLQDGNNWYMLNWKERDNGVPPIGAMLTGWQQTDDGVYYYMHSDGKMATGWQLIDGKWYYMDKSGHWLGKDSAVNGTIFGVDVSRYQEDIDWTALRNTGVDFAFVRIGHGSRNLDTYYKQNMQEANAAGVATGVYFYSTAQSVAQAVLDAQFVIDNLAGYTVSYPVAIDLEDKSQSNLTKEQITEIAKAFCDEIRAAGYTPMVYCNESWYRNRIDFSQLPDVERWIARYNYEPASDISRDVWQAGSTAVLPGISGVGRVDVDFSYKNYRNIIPPRTAASPYYTKRTGTWILDANGWWYSYFTGGYPANKWEYIGGRWYYFDGNGYALMGGWHYINGQWYYMDGNGAMVTGWVWDGYNWYYMNPSGAMATGWVWDGANWYYMNGSGAMVTGWVWDGANWYYMNGSGAMVTGWVLDKGLWYYMNPSGAMATGWVWDGWNWYYMNGSGAMLAGGWYWIDGAWYYMNGSGAMVTGWVLDKGLWYYMNPSGAMTTGWVWDGRNWYYMYGNGAMASNTWIGNYHVNASGAWDR